MKNITLTQDQQNAVDSLIQFLADPKETAFVLSGYAGTGKSTLVNHLVSNLPKLLGGLRLIDQDFPEYTITLTATTNKAAENLSLITGQEVRTIHSLLGLLVETDYKTRKTKLVVRNNTLVEDTILFVDECSYVDSDLLTYIFQRTKNCKIVFLGDRAQLTPVMSNNVPVFAAGFPGAQLTQVMRQAEGNPIIDLATKFRETVNTGNFFSFTPDGFHIKYLTRKDFDQAVEAEFSSKSTGSSKILAWTNKAVEVYNKGLAAHCSGRTTFEVGDYVVCNKFFMAGKQSVKTDQTVMITGVSEPVERHGVTGRVYSMSAGGSAFCADSLAERNKRYSKARAEGDLDTLADIDERWIDLRAIYACTINKSQGSTYDKVFIDLDDIKRCNSGNQIARILYVGVSRARHHVYLTGDLV